MASFTQGLMVIGNVLKNIADDKDDYLKVNPDIVTNGKITRVMSNFVITPNIIIDENLKHMEPKYLKDLIKTKMLTFTAFVTNAYKVLAEIYGLSVNMVINKMSNPGKLPNMQDVLRGREIYNTIGGNESIDYLGDAYKTEGFLPLTPGTEAPHVQSNTSFQKDVASYTNGYEIQLQVNGRVVSIPVVIIPNIRYTNADTLVSNMVEGDNGKTFMERFMDYRAGAIGLSDLIFATDLVKKYRDRKLRNENDIAKYLNAVDKTHLVKDVLHNSKNFSKNFNLYVFDNSIKPTIEKYINGSILKDRYKDKLTDKLMAFSIAFVDNDKEQVLILIDSIPGFSVLNYNMLKAEKNNEIKDIISELMNNRQPF